MNIQYKLQIDNYIGEVSSVTIVGQNICIPLNPANKDYQQFLKDIKEGVELLDADGNVVTDFVKELS